MYETKSEDDPEYTCPENFTFVSVTTNNLWQEAQLTNIYCDIVYYPTSTGPKVLRVSISQLYFGMAYYNVEGGLVFSNNTAKATATDALNEAEWQMRQYFKRNPSATALQLQNYWIEQTDYYMKLLTENRGKATKTGSIHPSTSVSPIPYNPCNSDSISQQ